jgi:hypothetical protein
LFCKGWLAVWGRWKGEGGLTAHAASWAEVEGEVAPSCCFGGHGEFFTPAFGAEVVCVLAVEVLASVEREEVIAAFCALWYEDWGAAVRAATNGKNGVTGGDAAVQGGDGVDS